MVSYSVGHVSWMLALDMRHISENLRNSMSYRKLMEEETEEQTHCQQQGSGLVKEIVPHVRLDQCVVGHNVHDLRISHYTWVI